MEPKQAYEILKNDNFIDETHHPLSDVVTPLYAEVTKGRWKEVEEYIKKDPYLAYCYARDVIKGRWIEAEDIIKKDPSTAYCYALDVIQGRFPEAEEYIKTDPKWAPYYAKNVMNDENFWERREEELLLNDPLKLINDIHQSRVKELEQELEQERERERQEAIRLQNIVDKHQRLKDWLQKIESIVDEHNIDINSLIPNQDQDFDEIEIKKNIIKYVGENIPVVV